MDFAFAAVGLAILVLAGDVLVRGAVNVSLRLGIPAFIVSLTIVAIGTSAPELIVAVSSVLEGVPGIAVGNVVGSNTANVLLVLGLPAVIAGLHGDHSQTRHSYKQMLAVTALFLVMAHFQPITWVYGIVLLGIYALLLVQSLLAARQYRILERKRKAQAEIEEQENPGLRWWQIFSLLGIGLVGLPLGADILVDSATNIARQLEIDEAIIGLTLVAIGTSLPELATTIAAALRRQADVALGNVIGSNIANLLVIMGVTSMFGAIPISQEILSFDLWIMAGASLLIMPFVFWNWQITRAWGFVLTGLYITYVSVVLF